MADVCEGYTYALAIQDVVPIVFGGLGFVFLARRLAKTLTEAAEAVYAAAIILIIGSALAGPIRKALIAGGVGCEDLGWAQIPFFSSMPACFALLAWASIGVLKGRKITFWPFGIALVVVFVVAVGVDDTLPFLAAGGLFAVLTAGALVVMAKRQDDPLTMVLYALYAVGTLALPALASNEDRAASSHQWLEQGSNTITQGLFALAGYRLLRSYTRSTDRPRVLEK